MLANRTRAHQGELSWVVKFDARSALARRSDRRYGELPQLATVGEGFENVLLDVEMMVECAPEKRETLHRLVHSVIVDIVACGLSAQDEVIANILFDEAVAIVAANHRVRQVDASNYLAISKHF